MTIIAIKTFPNRSALMVSGTKFKLYMCLKGTYARSCNLVANFESGSNFNEVKFSVKVSSCVYLKLPFLSNKLYVRDIVL